MYYVEYLEKNDPAPRPGVMDDVHYTIVDTMDELDDDITLIFAEAI